MRIGLISDTHDLLRDSAREFLRGCDRIVHAGDICGPDVLAELSRIAPVVAVRGNNDRGEWARALPVSRMERVAGKRIYVVHDLKDMDIDPAEAGIDVVVSGHSHRPLVTERAGVLYVNPGSAGRRRFKLPICVAELLVVNGSVSARLVELPDVR